ncbi:GntR family transcriptional regulator [Enterococcus sp. AZ128]|uniref:GntR family transcriptional regulator n=1 Tax=unclassified Enterococcus TaxID=2608891 RepID=UPI003F68464E
MTYIQTRIIVELPFSFTYNNRKGGVRMAQKVIDKNKPLYLQIKETILQQINESKLTPGDKLLSEAQFQKSFGVSRITVRKAIDELVEEGYLTRLQGKGTFVKKKAHDPQKSLSLTQVCLDQGKKLNSEVLLVNEETVPSEFKELFSTDRVILVERLRKIDGVPIMLERNFLPTTYSFLFKNDLAGSLYQVLNTFGIEPKYKGLNQVSISQLTDQQAKLFNVQSGLSVIHHKGSVYDSKNQLVLVAEELVRVDLPDLFKYYL